MKLNRETKHSVKVGNVLKFTDGSAYEVTGIQTGADRPGRASAVSFTLRNLNSGTMIYGYPSSKLYGAEILESNQGYLIVQSVTWQIDEDGTEHRIVFGAMDTGNGKNYCTWESVARNGNADYFWGHYFLDDVRAAKSDFHARLAERYA